MYSPLRDYLFPFPSDIPYTEQFLELEIETGYIVSSMFLVLFMTILYFSAFSLNYLVYRVARVFA